MHPPKMTGRQYHEALAVIRPGDIILTLDSAKLGAKLTPGLVSHAALCVNVRFDQYKGVIATVAEMTTKGYGEVDLFDVFHHSNRVLILRCNDWDPDYANRVIERCRELGKEKHNYDQQFEFGDNELYCSELVYEADFEHRLKVTPGRMFLVGDPFISPEHIRRAENCTKVYDSDFYLCS